MDDNTMRVSFTPSQSGVPEVPDADLTLPAGPAGHTPKKGVDYFDGAPGTSVSVESVTESTEDGGVNLVKFSDGKQLNVRNGNKGKDGLDGDPGYTPKKGVDYFDGAPGTSVEIESITESTEDGAVTLLSFLTENS